jgi:beta-N-acetylhexosaminidase
VTALRAGGLQLLVRLVVALVLTLQTGAAAHVTARSASASTTPSLAQLVGQKLAIRMDGTTPSTSLLGRIRRGEVGGIVLFGFNITTKSALIAAITKLQSAAAAGGQPPLLIMVDQEGGTVRRIPWAGPTLSAKQMGIDNSVDEVTQQGVSSAAALKASAINVNLAPVADVAASGDSFMYLQSRTFAFSNTRVSRLSIAFAKATSSKGVVPVFKHFPGIGRAIHDTDSHKVVITASKASMEKDLLPFRNAIAAGAAPMLMLSNAIYSAWDSTNAAGWSKPMAAFIRNDLGYTGVTITDSLTGTSSAYGITATTLAARACRAGTDMVMLTGTEASTAASFRGLMAYAESGSIPTATLRTSYARILALKSQF